MFNAFPRISIATEKITSQLIELIADWNHCYNQNANQIKVGVNIGRVIGEVSLL